METLKDDVVVRKQFEHVHTLSNLSDNTFTMLISSDYDISLDTDTVEDVVIYVKTAYGKYYSDVVESELCRVLDHTLGAILIEVVEHVANTRLYDMVEL